MASEDLLTVPFRERSASLKTDRSPISLRVRKSRKNSVPHNSFSPEGFDFRSRKNSLSPDELSPESFRPRKNSIHCSLVGDGMVGKTTLAKTFTEHSDESASDDKTNYVATIFNNYIGCAEFAGKEYDIIVLDSSGEHESDSIRSVCLRKSDVVIVCFCMSDRESYLSIESFWGPSVRSINHNASLVLVGTWLDIKCEETSKVTMEEGKKLAEDINAKTFVECHLSNQKDVDNLFKTVVEVARTHRKKRNIMHKFFSK